MSVIPVSVVGRVFQLHATTGVKVPVATDEFGITVPENHFGREPFWSMARRILSSLASPMYPAMRVGTERIYTL